MKKVIVIACCVLMSAFSLSAQIATDPRTEEYATVRAIISTETGGFSQTTTLPNPFLEMETASMELLDYVRDSKGAKFGTLTEMINYMNKFSWVLVDHTSVAMKPDSTQEAMLLYTFKRKPQKK